MKAVNKGGELVATLIRKNFSSPDLLETPFEKGKIETVFVGGLTVQQVTLQPGWRWSTHVKPLDKTDSCERFHVNYVISGRQKVVMNDGTEIELHPGDLAIIPSGHDAWVVGDEPSVLIEWATAVKQTSS